MKIGVLDSGIGGLHTLKVLKEVIPYAQYFFTSHGKALGNKSEKQIYAATKEMVKELLLEKVELIVIACNTATAFCIDKLRAEFTVPFVGIEPFIKYPLLNPREDQKIALLITRALSKSERFQQLLEKFDKEHLIDIITCPRLASLIEKIYLGENVWNEIEAELSPLKNKNYSHVLLGCTHYPIIQDYIANHFSVKTIHPTHAVAKRVEVLVNGISKTQDKSTNP